jgi:hypothetical protein
LLKNNTNVRPRKINKKKTGNNVHTNRTSHYGNNQKKKRSRNNINKD